MIGTLPSLVVSSQPSSQLPYQQISQGDYFLLLKHSFYLPSRTPHSPCFSPFIYCSFSASFAGSSSSPDQDLIMLDFFLFSIRTHFLGGLIQSHSFNTISVLDTSQIYISIPGFSPELQTHRSVYLLNIFTEVSNWTYQKASSCS